MCGIAGWINFDDKDCGRRGAAEGFTKKMCDALSPRGPDAAGEYVADHAVLLHRRLAVVDLVGGRQPMSCTHGGAKYTVVYNGELYNTPELRAKLETLGHKFETSSDTEVLLKSFVAWGRGCLDRFNGIFAFAIWNEKTKKLFCARDPIGVKPFFYKHGAAEFVFASELKSLFRHPNCPAVLTRDGINEIFLLAPGRIQGSGVYKDICELKPAEYCWVSSAGIKKYTYFKYIAKPHKQNYEMTKRHLRRLVVDAIDRQLVSDVELATFLSGGLDSSIITHVAAKKYAAAGKPLTTFSVDYRDNEQYFEKNAFQPDSDKKYIDIMGAAYGTNGRTVVLDNDDLYRALAPAALARDLAGMADIDSSLLLFAREIKKTHTVCLSGECADELFGGYPWFFKPSIGTFPWSPSIDMRTKILKKQFQIKNPKKFVNDLYQKTIADTDCLPTDTAREREARQMFKLNVDWFMQTLLDRKDRMSMATGLEVRVPFCDKRLARYAYNIPFDMKAKDGREKGLLRDAFRGILPDEIITRKKSPYPKTFDPKYFENVKKGAGAVMDSGGIVSQIIDHEYFDHLLTLPPNDAAPWYGQLMRLPQLFAFIIQMDTIFVEYGVKLEI
jgi:asparagine synthase (glutamine-hydrolysing)